MDFSRIKVGAQHLDDAVLTLGDFKKTNPRFSDKNYVLNVIYQSNYEEMFEISNYYFKTSGIYSRLCRYMAYLFRYDWLVTPFIVENNPNQTKLLNAFNETLRYLEKFKIKKYFAEVSLKVVRNGCYYGYLIRGKDTAQVQELPIKYCRTRFAVNGKPAIEFNMRYFDEAFRDPNQRIRILNLFPKEFKRGYQLYKEGKLPPDWPGDKSGWYLLDTDCAFKFSINDDDQPLLISVIPAIIDLDAAKDLDRQKMAQQLLKIIIQKMPLDKNGDMIFDMEEARDLHNNAVAMIGKSIGLDVLTTFADVDVADMADSSTNTATDELERVERAVYNEAGVSQMQFNTDGNIALEKSILNDEATMYNLLIKFEDFLNDVIKIFNKQPKKYYFQVQLLNTTIYNYKDMAKLYKENTQLGYSKMLPQVALGQSQSSVLATAFFENDVLDLVNVFIPPVMSSTMNAEVLDRSKSSSSDSNAGRPEKPDDEKSTKTLQNKEAQS